MTRWWRALLLASSGEITIAGLWRTFRRGIRLGVLVALFTALAAGAVLKLSEPVYEASMTVAPPARDLELVGRLTSELEQYAGLATFAQRPVEIESVSTLDRYLTLLRSTRLAERLSDDRTLMTTSSEATGTLLPRPGGCRMAWWRARSRQSRVSLGSRTGKSRMRHCSPSDSGSA